MTFIYLYQITFGVVDNSLSNNLEKINTTHALIFGFIVILLIIGISVLTSDPVWTRLSAIATILFSLILIYLNFKSSEIIKNQAINTEHLVKAQTRPFVYVSLKTGVNRRYLINMNIENIGLGIAKNVKFSIDHELITESGPLSTYPIIREGLPYFAPKENRNFVIMNFRERQYSEYQNFSFKMKVNFESIDKEKFEFEYPLSFREFNLLQYESTRIEHSFIGKDPINLTQAATCDMSDYYLNDHTKK